MKFKTITVVALALGLSSVVSAATLEEEILVIQHDWAQIQYQMPEKQREAAFEKLETRAEQLVREHPERAEPLIWDGIVLSTWAGASGGLGALGLVKRARHQFEQAMDIDPSSLEGSALTSLGSLYYQVPGWPIGFGDDDKAENLLSRALMMNPDGIDSNYFYADYLLDQGNREEARKYFQKALQAPPRPQRPVADEGRRRDIQAKLAGIS